MSNAQYPPQARWPCVGRFSYTAADDRWEWSGEVAQMHGYQPGTVTVTTDLILSHKHPDDKPTVAQLIDQVRRHGEPFSSRHRIIDTAGKVHVVVVVGDRCYGDDGQVTGTSGFYVDITQEFDADLQSSVNEIVDHLSQSRAVINQAIGMLMLTYGVTAERAFDVLAWRSSDSNMKLRNIAAQFVVDASSDDLLPAGARARVDHLLLTVHERVAADDHTDHEPGHRANR